MSRDRDLIDTIKTSFARKSSAQLQEIAQAKDHERWSADAIAAADEVLQDRRAGLAQEPLVAEEEPPPPPLRCDTHGLAVAGLAAFGLLTGFWVVPVFRVDYAGSPDPDLPVPFGPRMAWLALETTDTAAVATALGLRDVRTTSWADGINAAHRASVFVTPPLADWTLAVSSSLFPPERAEALVKPLLEKLSLQFGDAQYFCTHSDVELHVWARAKKGRLVRGYGWFGQKRLTLWNEGAQTKAERDLGFRFVDEQAITAEPGQNKTVSHPDEDCVMQLALLWSIDPTTLDEQFDEPVSGLLGSVAEGAAERVEEIDRTGITARRDSIM